MKNHKIINGILNLIFIISLLGYEINIHASYYNYFQMIIMALTFLAFSLIYKDKTCREQFQQKLRRNLLIFILALFMFISTLIATLLYNNNIYTVFIVAMYVFNIFFYFIMLPIYCKNNKEYQKKMFELISIIITIISLFGILLYFKNGLLGYYLESKRSGSIFFDPNFFAVISAMPILFCMQSNYKKTYKYLIVVIAIFAIVVSGSRGTMISLLLCILYYAVIKQSSMNMLQKILLIVFTILIFVGTFYLLNSIGFWRTFQGSNGRAEMLEYTLIKIQESPLVGFGFDGVASSLSEGGFVSTTTHNSLFDNILRYGIPCTVIYLLVLAKCVLTGFFKNKIIWLNLLVIFLIVNMNTILYSFGGVGFPSMLLTFSLGLVVGENNEDKNKN